MSELITWSPGVTLDSIEKQTILLAFRHFRGNKTTTANALGISVRTLDTKLDRYLEEGQAEKERQKNEQLKREEFLRRQRGELADSTWRIPPPNPQAQAGASHLDAGVRVESASSAPQKSAMPVSEQKEVQGVLPSKAPASGASKPRR